MNEQDVRALVREAIERHLGRPSIVHSQLTIADVHPSPLTPYPSVPSVPSHPSHIILNVAAGGEVEDGMCLIEPRVRCNHCGFCQSYGH